MNQEHEEVLVFPVALFPDLPAEGVFFELDWLPKLLGAAEFIGREQAEQDPAYKQLIPYAIIRYADQIFRYRRSGQGGESRLHGLYSIGVGGHVNRHDVLPGMDYAAALEWARDRELNEEFAVECPGIPRLIGLLNDNRTEVGRVHFGVIYEYWLEVPTVDVREEHLHLHHGFIPLYDLIAHDAQYEGWSRLIISQYLAKQWARR